MFTTQISTNDCGLFALSHVAAVCAGNEPALITFNQDTMRLKFNEFKNRDMMDFSVDVISNKSGTHLSKMTGCTIQIMPVIN